MTGKILHFERKTESWMVAAYTKNGGVIYFDGFASEQEALETLCKIRLPPPKKLDGHFGHAFAASERGQKTFH